jgi:hypothetical protein
MGGIIKLTVNFMCELNWVTRYQIFGQTLVWVFL